MGEIKILQTADWHIGTFNGPEINGENGRYNDICAALDRLCEEAGEENPDFILFAGDMFHAAKTWSDRGLKENRKAVEIIRRLALIAPVVVLRGTPNHDSEQQFELLKSTFEGDKHVTICTEPGIHDIVNDYSGFDKIIRVAALPGFDRGYFRAKNPGLSSEEENSVFSKALKDLIIGMGAKSSPYVTVLMAHYTVAGSNMESGQTALFEKYEPIIYPADLETANYDLVCVGHIHRPQCIFNNMGSAGYYCGALTQLNFNDEGQDRGYYIHKLKDDGAVCSSEFHKIPSREFVTLHFGDCDISDFNKNGDILILKEFKNKIVRVLYTCTDEHNKAFNKTLLERKLLEHGAYYVQEITPKEILVTANKEELRRDSSPEENLIAYLAEKQIPDEKIASIVELARPLIAKATANISTNTNAGLFMPIEISVRNYRNYRDETFSFENISFCTINGNNGVGKSSLFMDAIIDALFEEPREGDLTGWISNDKAARSGSIQFIFALGDKKYRVTRTRAKSGKATLNLSEFMDGDWCDRSKEKYRDTQAAITETLGMDSLTIKACALIMQDQYGLFLQADKESRMNVLGNILGLKAYEKMEQMVSERATDVNREIRLAMDKINEKTANAPNVEELKTEQSMIENEVHDIQNTIDEKRFSVQSLTEIIANQESAAQTFIKLESKIQTIDSTITEKEAAKANQQAIIFSAEKVLEQRDMITAMTTNYDNLVQAEKQMVEKKAVYTAAKERLTNAQKEATTLGVTISEQEKELDKVNAEIMLSETQLAREQELKTAHANYLHIQRELEEQIALKSAVEKLKAEYERACGDEQRVRELAEAEKDKLRFKISDIEKKIAIMTYDCECIDIEKAHCKFLKDALESKARLPEYEAKIAAIEEESTVKLETLKNYRLEVQKSLDEKVYNESRTDALEAKLNAPTVKEQERSYAQLETVRVKYTAQQERKGLVKKSLMDFNTRKKTLETEIQTLEAKLIETHFDETKYSDICVKIETAKMWREKEKVLPLAEEQKKAAMERIADIEAEIKRLTDEKVEAYAEIENIKSKVAGYENNKAALKHKSERIAELEEALSKVTMRLGEVNSKINAAKALQMDIESCKERIEKYKATAAGYEELKYAFSQEGIPHNIVRSIIPTLEATASNILGQMSGGKMSVEIVTEKTLKSNSKKEVTTLDVIINDVNTGRLPYLSRSGGERVKAALSIILALSEIKSTKAGVQLGFLFIDEPPFLDAEGVQAYCDALEAIQKRYSSLKVMAITHDPSMKARFPQSVDVVKTEAGSKVI